VAPVSAFRCRCIAVVALCLASTSHCVANSVLLPPRQEYDLRSRESEDLWKSLGQLTLVGAACVFAAMALGLRRMEDYATTEEEPEQDFSLAEPRTRRHELRALNTATAAINRRWFDVTNRGTREPAVWRLGEFATFRAPSGEMWLRFDRDSEMQYTEFHSIHNGGGHAAGFHNLTASILPVLAGQLVRVLDADLPDDGLAHNPTVRADWGEVYVADPTVVRRFAMRETPSLDAAGSELQRTADDVAFWRAMIEAPEDDLPRLMYADYLDERCDPAGIIVRDSAPFTLQYCVESGQRWEERNRRRASWRIAAREFCALIQEGACEFGPGLTLLSMRCQVDLFSAPPDGESRCLILTDASGKRPPPFVNYVLQKMVISLMVKSEAPTAAEV